LEVLFYGKADGNAARACVLTARRQAFGRFYTSGAELAPFPGAVKLAATECERAAVRARVGIFSYGGGASTNARNSRSK
jgi:hypothetical protein